MSTTHKNICLSGKKNNACGSTQVQQQDVQLKNNHFWPEKCNFEPKCLTYSALGDCTSEGSCNKTFKTPDLTEQECSNSCSSAKWQPTVCTLSNYAQRIQNYYDLSSEEDCLDKCEQLQNCTFHIIKSRYFKINFYEIGAICNANNC